MRLMYDSGSIPAIPRDAQMVGYYIDGAYKASGSQLALFPNAVKVPIAVFPTTNAGIVFDGPPDNSTWPRVVDWVVMRRAAGVDPTVYTDADQWSTGLAEFRARGVAPPHWWIAKWDGRNELIPGAVAHQFTGNQHGGFDRSAVVDHWPGVDTAPPPAPVPVPPAPAPLPLEDDLMLLLAVTPSPVGGNAAAYYLLSGPMISYVPDTQSLSALQGAGVKSAAVTKAFFDTLSTASATLKGNLTGQLAVQGNLNVA